MLGYNVHSTQVHFKFPGCGSLLQSSEPLSALSDEATAALYRACIELPLWLSLRD